MFSFNKEPEPDKKFPEPETPKTGGFETLFYVRVQCVHVFTYVFTVHCVHVLVFVSCLLFMSLLKVIVNCSMLNVQKITPCMF